MRWRGSFIRYGVPLLLTSAIIGYALYRGDFAPRHPEPQIEFSSATLPYGRCFVALIAADVDFIDEGIAQTRNLPVGVLARGDEFRQRGVGETISHLRSAARA